VRRETDFKSSFMLKQGTQFCRETLQVIKIRGHGNRDSLREHHVAGYMFPNKATPAYKIFF
jgi:hypothetical protein